MTGKSTGRNLDRAAAAALAAELLRKPQDDPERPWHLEEFTEGWLICIQSDNMGAAAKVIEKITGNIRFFPSRISPDRIVEEYESVVDSSRVVSISEIWP
ncbi:hypothetical protein [Frankia sp. AgKG'84/4]|uniref:hypothetical protein n=1 Tax=Frankia sp. AgKG'84/4 TaxID=573490 RepID=UPI00200C3F80|nr:hypothetical protein [Frankia sp. AgKG'84/4]MCL9793826.1 hypothetical protein [Frankia sp. AgKG'84/4]